MKVNKIEFLPVGLSVEFKTNIDDYNKKILKSNLLNLKKLIVSIAGPALNILIVIMIIVLRLDLKNNEIIIYSNLIIAIFNMIPIYPLDGGRVLKYLFIMILGRKKAYKLIHTISNITFIIILIIFSILLIYLKNFTLVIIICYLGYLVKFENKNYILIEKTYRILECYKL